MSESVCDCQYIRFKLSNLPDSLRRKRASGLLGELRPTRTIVETRKSNPGRGLIMRALRSSIPFRTGLFFYVLVSALLWSGRTDAAIENLFSNNSSVTVDSGSQHGLFNWLIDGVNLAPTEGGGINDYRQWFWYSIGAAAPASVNELVPATM